MNLLVPERPTVVKNWFRVNGFLLNENKTQILNFGLKDIDNNLQFVNLLGFHLDKKLCWKHHVDKVSNKISRVIFLLRKLRDIIPLEGLRNVYFSLFQSHVSYGLHLWGHASSVKDILLCQKRAIRIMLNKKSTEHCKPLFIKLRILTVYNLFIYLCLVYIHTNISNYCLRSDIRNRYRPYKK